MHEKPFTIEQILTLLAEAPPRIAALTSGLTAAQLKSRPNEDQWSANEVLAHIRSCADVWGGCIATILAQKTPIIRAVNPTTWIKSTDYPEQEFQPSLQAYTNQRADLMSVLAPLPFEAWSLAVTVTVAGKPRERTVFFYAQWLARHERPHVRQIERIVNTMRV